MIKNGKYFRTILAAVVSLLLLTSINAAPPDKATPIRLKAKSGAACVILPYDFDKSEPQFPELGLPDNALLVLKVEKTGFRPEDLVALQGVKKYKPVGIIGYSFWGNFYAVYFDQDFNKFNPYELRLEEASYKVLPDTLAGLKGKAQPAGTRAWQDPVTESAILNADPLELTDLMARGRALEFTNEAMDLRGIGGLALVRAESEKAFEKKDYLRAACLAGEAIKWSPIGEPSETRFVTTFQDWVTVARAFKEMGEILASLRAYDQALKVYNDGEIRKERQAILDTYSKKGGGVAAKEYYNSLSEAELALEPHGQIPIPDSEKNVIRDGISANGVFLGDHMDRIMAQCGQPTEKFSGMILYFDHPVCPRTVFFTPLGRAYSIRAVRGKTIKGAKVGDSMKKVISLYGQPNRKETNPSDAGGKPVIRWIYMNEKIAFVDLTGNDKIDAIDVFDYTLNR